MMRQCVLVFAVLLLLSPLSSACHASARLSAETAVELRGGCSGNRCLSRECGICTVCTPAGKDCLHDVECFPFMSVSEQVMACDKSASPTIECARDDEHFSQCGYFLFCTCQYVDGDWICFRDTAIPSAFQEDYYQCMH